MLANSDFVYSENCDEIVKTFFLKPKGDSFLNFGLTNEERAFEYNRKIKEACRPNHFKLRSERGHFDSPYSSSLARVVISIM